MKYIYILIISTINITYSQNNCISVKYVVNFGPVSNNETLIIQNNYSKYQITEEINVLENNIEKEEDKNEYKFNFFNNELEKLETYQSLNNRVIHQIHYYNKYKTKVCIIDSLPDFKWQIKHNEKKVIGNYNCVKASTHFRGTEIVAYFTESLPFSFGPWKFGKLPGLILEVYTENAPMKFHWNAVEIIYPFKTNEITKYDVKDCSDIISMKTYIINLDNERKEKEKILDSRMPNGIVQSSKSKTTRLGVEKKYEWEK